MITIRLKLVQRFIHLLIPFWLIRFFDFLKTKVSYDLDTCYYKLLSGRQKTVIWFVKIRTDLNTIGTPSLVVGPIPSYFFGLLSTIFFGFFSSDCLSYLRLYSKQRSQRSATKSNNTIEFVFFRIKVNIYDIKKKVTNVKLIVRHLHFFLRSKRPVNLISIVSRVHNW